MDCLVTYEVSLEETGARVEYLSDYVSSQDIADHIEDETWFEVTCQEAVE